MEGPQRTLLGNEVFSADWNDANSYLSLSRSFSLPQTEAYLDKFEGREMFHSSLVEVVPHYRFSEFRDYSEAYTFYLSATSWV